MTGSAVCEKWPLAALAPVHSTMAPWGGRGRKSDV